MKLLVAFQNMNGLGGSEIFNHELITGLSIYKDLDITVATLTEPNISFRMWDDIIKLGIKVTSLQQLSTTLPEFDLIVVSQPQPTSILCQLYPNTPKISIIHSILRSEEPIKHPSIKQYVPVQADIYKGLKNFHNISPNIQTLIFNPVDETRFNNINKDIPFDTHGLFVGEVNDSLRRPMLEHIVTNCINNRWKLTIISRSKCDFQSDLIKIIDPVYDTEKYLKNVSFAAGLRGRVCIEALMCDVPFYAYDVDQQGRILKVELLEKRKTWRFNKEFVCSKHYNLIKRYE